VTPLPTPAELRELADNMPVDVWAGTPKTQDALRQFATLIESIESIHRMAINKTDMITADAIMMIKRGEIVS
jgi:hypothetical protein